jgi:hypothetical protein
VNQSLPWRTAKRQSADTRSREPEWERLEDGGIRSVQSTVLAYAHPAWPKADRLEQLLRQYFAVAERCTGPLLRVRWRDGAPAVTPLWPPLPLIAMGAPSVEQHAGLQSISVPICGGLLAAPGPHGLLSIAFRREAADIKVSVVLAGYRPRGDRFIALRWLYRSLQARLHVHVGQCFLRELQRS